MPQPGRPSTFSDDGARAETAAWMVDIVARLSEQAVPIVREIAAELPASLSEPDDDDGGYDEEGAGQE